MPKYERPETLGETIFKSLQGQWRVVYSEIDGEMTPAAESATTVLTLKGNNFSVEKNGKADHAGFYRINVARMPHGIPINYTKSNFEGNLGGTRSGIFQVIGDTLKLVLPAVGEPEPKDFVTYADSDLVLTVLQRVGSEKGIGATVSRTRSVSLW